MSDKSTEKTSFNGVFVDIQTNDDGNLEFSAGYDFDDEVTEEYIEYMKDMLAGIFSAVSTQMEALVVAGRSVRSTPEFEDLLADLHDKNSIMEHDGKVIRFPSTSKH